MSLAPFQRLLDETREDVYRFLVASVGPDDADECFQETYLSALAAYPGVRDGSNVRAWLFTIAHRKAIDRHRSRARAPLGLDAAPPASVEAPAPSDEELWARVRALPTKQRAAVTFRFLGDLAYREIGEALGCSEQAARRNVHEGLVKLRQERGIS